MRKGRDKKERPASFGGGPVSGRSSWIAYLFAGGDP